MKLDMCVEGDMIVGIMSIDYGVMIPWGPCPISIWEESLARYGHFLGVEPPSEDNP